MKDIKINMCCGKTNFGKSWYHADKANLPHIDYCNVKSIPEPNGVASEIYCSHGIAYFSRQEITEILAEWYRLLKPGGILRIATPDFKVICEMYQKGAPVEDMLGLLYGKMPMNTETIYHKTTYDYTSLYYLLKNIGFKRVRRYDYAETEYAHIDDAAHAHYPHDNQSIATGEYKSWQTLISLNVQAEK